MTPSQVRAIRVLALRTGECGPRSWPTTCGSRRGPPPRSWTPSEAKGLVARSPDPGDRRAVVVSLTDRGHELSEEVRRARGVESEKMFSRLTDADRDALARILGKLQDDEGMS